MADPIKPSQGKTVPTVLVVDDDEMVRAMTQLVLQEYGFAVLCASDGQEGVALFQTHGADIGLAILDLSLPDMDGLEVCHLLRQQRGDLPVILMSGSIRPTAQDDTHQWVFLQKPFRINQLLEAIQKVMAR